MIKTLAGRPFFVNLMGIGALAMFIPSVHALYLEQHAVSRAFFYSALLFGVLTLFIGFATANYKSSLARGYLVSLLAAFLVLPIMLAIPIYEAVPRIAFREAWFEAVSSITTTGATLYDSPRELPPSVHLWRAMMGWFGGLLMWIAAISIFAPLNIGGFEIRATRGGTASKGRMTQVGRVLDPSERLIRFGVKLVPLYVALTLLLWLGLVVAGEVPFVAICHAMSVLSTSGISPVGGLVFSPAGWVGEAFCSLLSSFCATAPSPLTKERTTASALRCARSGVGCLQLRAF